MFKQYIQNKFAGYVRQYFQKHPEVKLVVVAGSVGKTSTKRAIGTVLAESYRVRMHEGNHNTNLSAAVAILGLEYPGNIRNPLMWLRLFSAAKKRIHDPTDVDVIVQELGVDREDHMAEFAKYLHPDIAVITAVAPEHMEYFKTLDAVAAEELVAANFSKEALINRDAIDDKYANLLTNANINTYGNTAAAEYRFEVEDFAIEKGYTGTVVTPNAVDAQKITIQLVGEHSLYAVAAAIAVGAKLGMKQESIRSGLANVRAVPGRMNLLRGVENTMIIDDSYNASPSAVQSALQTLYNIDAPQRIAILGSMNELGETSADAHKKVGEFCDPTLLAWVITIGEEAEKYLAPAAKAKGCQVKSFRSAIEAGAFARKSLEPNAVILAKGSEGGIYTEEAVKLLLHETSENEELVRQSAQWMKIKENFFNSL